MDGDVNVNLIDGRQLHDIAMTPSVMAKLSMRLRSSFTSILCSQKFANSVFFERAFLNAD